MTRPSVGVDPAKAIDYVRDFASSWEKAKAATRATIIQSLYEEIVVRGEEFVSVRLTPEAYAHGLATALPQEVAVPAPQSRGPPRKIWRWRGRQVLDARLQPTSSRSRDGMSGRLRRGRLRSPRDSADRARFAHGRVRAATLRDLLAVGHMRQSRCRT
jgi:hypothetical protein